MDFSTIEITSKKVRGNHVDFSTSKITSKKVRGNHVDFSTIDITSKKYAEMTWKFVEIWSSAHRCNIQFESTWIRRGVPVWNLWWEGPHFLKNIVEYDNRSRKQAKIEIDDSLLNSCNGRIVKTNSYLVTSEKKKNFQNITEIKNFSTLKKLLIITSWVLRFI